VEIVESGRRAPRPRPPSRWSPGSRCWLAVVACRWRADGLSDRHTDRARYALV